jgi:hypothetical protein
MVTKTTAPIDDLTALARQVDQGPPSAEQQQEEEAHEAQQQQAEAAALRFNATLEKMALGFFKAVRRKIAKSMPEILEEWPDDLFDEPAAAVPPVVQRYLGFLFSKLSAFPELGALCFSMVPLVMGYFAAVDRQDKRTVDEQRPQT